MILRYRGADGHGIYRTGRTERYEDAAAMAADFHHKGWKSLEITDGAGRELGGICLGLMGPRTWWGEV